MRQAFDVVLLGLLCQCFNLAEHRVPATPEQLRHAPA